MISIHIGKLPAAIPVLIDELRIDLFWAGLTVAAFSLLTGISGLVMGTLADRFGHDRAAFAGLGCAALGALLGTFSGQIGWLLASRILEGLGYILAAVSLPSLMSAASNAHDRPLALGLWGAFLPAGTSSMLLVSPLLITSVGWRGLWAVSALLTAVWLVVLIMAFRDRPVPTREAAPISDSFRLVAHRGPLLLFGCFIAYSAQFMAVTSFLPKLFIDEYQVTVTTAASLGALVITGNILGNIAGGWLLRHGLRNRILLAVAAGGMGLFSLVVYSGIFPLPVRTLAALLFTFVGGLIPGVGIASAPRYIDRPSQMASMMGFLIQAAGIGQVVGPVLLAATVSSYGGWSAAPLFTVTAATVGVICALALVRQRRP